MKLLSVLTILLFFLTLTACGRESKDDDVKLLKEQREMMDKARNVENVLQKSAEQQDRNIEQQSE